MKIKIYARDLQEMLKIAKGLQLNKLDTDLQKGLLIQTTKNKITLIMNNISTQLESQLYGTILTPGQALIPESTVKILENLKNDDLIITNKLIQYDTKEIKYMPGPAEDFYKITNDITNLLFEITESELKHLLEVNYATSEDESRPILKGIEIKDNRFIALNVYYASMRYTEDFYLDNPIILSQNIWKMLLKTINKKSDDPVKVFYNGKLIKFQFKNYSIIGQLLDGKYLNVDNIITDEYNTRIVLNTKNLINSVRLMKKLKGEKQLIKLSIDNNLKIETATDINTITDEIEIINFEGEKLEIYFDIRFFYDVINQFKNQEVVFEFKDHSNPMFIKSEGKLDFLLPVRRS